MSQYYLKQFIEEATKHVDSKIKFYFERQQSALKFEDYKFSDIVEETIDEFFEGKVNKQDLTPLVSKIKDTRRKKIKRLYEKTIKDYNLYSITDVKNPFFNIYTFASSLSYEEYFKLYKNKTLEQLVKEEFKKFEKWYNSEEILLPQCPITVGKQSNSIIKNIKSDIIINVATYIFDELGGNINSFIRTYPTELIEKPLFSPTPFSLVPKSASNRIFKEVIKDENDKNLLEMTVDNTKKENNLPNLKTMSSDDLELINILVSNIDTAEFFKYKSVTMDLSVVAQLFVGDYKPGKRIFTKIETICKRLVEYNFSYESDDTSLHFNLFDNILIKHDSSQRAYIIATFGDILFNGIVEEKLVSITSADYILLTNNLSKIICYALKQEQIIHQDNQSDDYSYSYFQRIVRFKLKNKKKNLQLIQESLDEFVKNGIVIKSYILNKDVFTINFLPLSQAEIDDFK